MIAAAKWWAENGDADQALRWHEGILSAIETLADNPDRCVLARENHKSDLELRELHYGVSSPPTHRVIFVIDPDAARVLAIRHVAQRDWDSGDK